MRSPFLERLESGPLLADGAMGALLEGGPDLIILETLPGLVELREAVLAARSVTDLPLVAQVTFTEEGRTLAGEDPAEVARALLDLGVDVVGANCGVGPQAALDV